ncbi:MAG: alpha-galactosidase [Clostridia bacterium]|nr:alpha-galactosidase [Clostridia bacterium]
MIQVICSQKNEAKDLSIQMEEKEKGIYYVYIDMDFGESVSPTVCKFSFTLPCKDVYSLWSPMAGMKRFISPNWSKHSQKSRLASGAPVLSAVAKSGMNRGCVALSDANTSTQVRCGVSEETANLEFEIRLFTELTAPMDSYAVTVRIDTREIPFYEALKDTEIWWRCDVGFGEAYVPDCAKMPMDSLWYSFHQILDPEKILEECRISKALGMDTVIIDDGWQTDDNNRGYEFCGDWELATGKIPDMKKLVDELHTIGMKVIVWFSVPFVGIQSKIHDRFLGMYVCHASAGGRVKCLDPRYKEVRDYLAGIYKNAVTEWGLDGLKLDFIDSFILSDVADPTDERRDTVSLEDGVEKLLAEVTETLRAINPDIMIEFRQKYIGPTIRKYGNMLRVADCPNDAINNKMGVVDLRMISGGSAVHSDMLMWHKEEKAEHAALQLLSTIFGVPQISIRLADFPEVHKTVIKTFLDFWRENRDILLEGELKAQDPDAGYSLVSSQKGSRMIAVRHLGVPFTMEEGIDSVSLFNATAEEQVVILGAKGATYTVTDCLGKPVASGKIADDLALIHAPMSAKIDLKK